MKRPSGDPIEPIRGTKRLDDPRIEWFGAMWWAYAQFAWIGFFQPLPDGRYLLGYELTFHRKVPEVAAREIVAFCKAKGINLTLTWLQADLFPKPGDRGEHIPETFRRNGVKVYRAPDNRPAAMSRLRSWLEKLPRPDGSETPTLVIHPRCREALKTLPTIQEDPDSPEDILQNEDSFAARAIGFFVMSRPMPFKSDEPPLPPGAIGHDVEELRRNIRRGV